MPGLHFLFLGHGQGHKVICTDVVLIGWFF